MSDPLKEYVRELDARIVMRGGRSLFGERLRNRVDTHVTPERITYAADGRRRYHNGVPLVEQTGVPSRDLRRHPRK